MDIKKSFIRKRVGFGHPNFSVFLFCYILAILQALGVHSAIENDTVRYLKKKLC